MVRPVSELCRDASVSWKMSIFRPAVAALAAMLVCALTVLSFGQDISTVAGGGTPGGNAKTAFVAYPAGVTRDSAGNTYFSSQSGQYVYKLDSSGNITAIAGLGYAEFSGDNGLATKAGLNLPGGLAFDKGGNLYIGDAGNNRIREISAKTGIITTVAGSGTPNMYFQGGYNGDNIPATSATLNSPYVVAVDSNGNLLIADYKNNRIREVNTKTGIITTVAGTGTAGYNGDGIPATQAEINAALAVFPANGGGFYITDSGNNRIRYVNTANPPIISTVAGDGTGGYNGDNIPATTAEINFPNDTVEDALSNLYIVDNGNSRIRRVLKSTGIISTVAGNGTQGYNGDGKLATKLQISDTSGAYVDNKLQQLLLADSGNQRVRTISGKTGVMTTLAGGGSQGDGGPATAAFVISPAQVALDANGNLFIAQDEPPGVREITNGKITTIAGSGSEGFSGDNGPATLADFFCVSGVAVDASGNVFISDTCNDRIRRVDHATHVVKTFAGNGSFCASPPACGDGGPATEANLGFPTQLATDRNGNLYIADVLNSVIRMVNAATGIIQTVGGDYAPCSNSNFPLCGDGGPATLANLSFPYGVSVDGNGNVFIADTVDNQIRRIDAKTGIISTVAFNMGLVGFGGDNGPATQAAMTQPLSVSVDTSGNLYIGGGVNSSILGVGGGYEVVRRVDATSGLITTVAGNDNNPALYGFAGDGGLATSALLNNIGATADNLGGFYIADEENNRVRKVGP